jgi:hypothetical protein
MFGCQINPKENINFLLKPTAQDLLNAFNQANYNLQDYQAVTTVVDNKYWEKPDLINNKKVDTAVRSVLIDDEIEEFAEQLKKNWGNIPEENQIHLICRAKQTIFNQHWLTVCLIKRDATLHVYFFESLGGGTVFTQRIATIFDTEFKPNINIKFYGAANFRSQLDRTNCPTFALDAAFRIKPNINPELIMLRNCQNIAMVDNRITCHIVEENEIFAYQRHHEKQKNKIPNKNPWTKTDHPFLYDSIDTKREHFKQDTIPFLQFLVQNPKLYEQMLEARKGIQFLTTGFKPNWLFFFVNPYIEPTEMLNYFLWQFKSWAKEWIQSATFYSSNRRTQGNEIINFVDFLNENKAATMTKINSATVNFGDKISKYRFCSAISEIPVIFGEKTNNIKNLLDNTGTAYGFNQKSPKEKLNAFLYELKIADRNAGIPLAFSEKTTFTTPRGIGGLKNMYW